MWNNLKKQFELDPNYIHLSLNMLAPHPKCVQDAIERHRSGFNRNPVLYHENKEAIENEILNKAARYLQSSPEQIALTESTTMGLSVVLSGLKMREGDEIICSVHDHYAMRELLRSKEKKEGICLKTIELYQNPREVTTDEILTSILNNLTPQTRLLALTWVHSCSGVKLPLAKIAQQIAQINASRNIEDHILIAVDGVHGFGVEDIHVEALGCDFFITGCHKWLFGPRGTGLVWGTLKGWQRIFPVITSFRWDVFYGWFQGKFPDLSCPRAWYCNPGGFQAYEHRWALGEAFDFQFALGKQLVYQHITKLKMYCQEMLETIPEVIIYTPKNQELSSGLVCFDVYDIDPSEVVSQMLKRKIIIGQTPYQKSVCRIAPGILNSQEDLDSAEEALRSLFARL
jgi:selenocysteine lyase/cysteine desulfurase